MGDLKLLQAGDWACLGMFVLLMGLGVVEFFAMISLGMTGLAVLLGVVTLSIPFLIVYLARLWIIEYRKHEMLVEVLADARALHTEINELLEIWEDFKEDVKE